MKKLDDIIIKNDIITSRETIRDLVRLISDKHCEVEFMNRSNKFWHELRNNLVMSPDDLMRFLRFVYFRDCTTVTTIISRRKTSSQKWFNDNYKRIFRYTIRNIHKLNHVRLRIDKKVYLFTTIFELLQFINKDKL